MLSHHLPFTICNFLFVMYPTILKLAVKYSTCCLKIFGYHILCIMCQMHIVSTVLVQPSRAHSLLCKQTFNYTSRDNEHNFTPRSILTSANSALFLSFMPNDSLSITHNMTLASLSNSISVIPLSSP